MGKEGDASGQRRRDERIEVPLAVRFRVADQEEFLERYSTNVSPSGIFIATDRELPIGTIIAFEILIEDGSAAFWGKGVVRWTRPHVEGSEPPGGLGVEFTELDDANQAVLAALLERQKRRGAVKAP